jgi:general L-amino acid transport system permease protein
MTAGQIRRATIQAAVALAAAALLLTAIMNARANLAARGVPVSLDFLDHVAGFGLNQSFIPYSPLSSYGRALLVGLVNTMAVSALAGALATMIGFSVGFARLSRNWALARLAGLYVETIRNIPLLLQMLFWYVAVLSALPGPTESLGFAGALLNNRGLDLPAPRFGPGASWVAGWLEGGVIAAFFWRRWALRKQTTGGKNVPIRAVAALLLVAPGLLAFFAMGRPIHFTFPVFDAGKNPFNVEGGLRLPPEIFALVLALSLYTASYIAEIVRAGVQSVARGQGEAAAALGLKSAQARKLVILPQAMRIIMPPLISQYLALAKNSSLAAFVGFADLMQVSGTILNQTGAAVQVIALDMAIYLALSLATLVLLRLTERRFAWRAAR